MSGAWQESRAIHRAARTAAHVLECLIMKDYECTADKPSHPIWVTTGAPAFNEPA